MKETTDIFVGTKVFVIDDKGKSIHRGIIESIYQDIHKHTAELFWYGNLGTFSVDDIFLDLDTLYTALAPRRDKEQRALSSKYEKFVERVTDLKEYTKE